MTRRDDTHGMTPQTAREQNLERCQSNIEALIRNGWLGTNEQGHESLRLNVAELFRLATLRAA